MLLAPVLKPAEFNFERLDHAVRGIRYRAAVVA